MDFTEKEKIALFDKISERYFERNFGTMLKSDMDTLIFSAYIEHRLDNDLPYDDYTLSNQLGITESRVRSLKERKQLQYPYKDYDWKTAFVKLIPNARYNETKKLIQLNIGDINLIKDVRNFVYSHGWYDEFQLNPKLFQCRLEFFISLCSKLEDDVSFDDNTKKALKSLFKSDKEKSAIDRIIDGDYEHGFKELVGIVSDDIIGEILKTIPFAGLAQKAIKELVKIIIK